MHKIVLIIILKGLDLEMVPSLTLSEQSKLHDLLLMNYDFFFFFLLCLQFYVLVVKVHFMTVIF